MKQIVCLLLTTVFFASNIAAASSAACHSTTEPQAACGKQSCTCHAKCHTKAKAACCEKSDK